MGFSCQVVGFWFFAGFLFGAGKPFWVAEAVGASFAPDSPLEGDGFEPSVPARKSRFFLRKANCGTERGQPKKVVFLCGTDGSNPSPSSGESAAESVPTATITSCAPPSTRRPPARADPTAQATESSATITLPLVSGPRKTPR